MDLRRLRAGEWVTALGGAALLVALFLPWYDEGAASPNAWESFAIVDVILALVGLAAVLLVAVTATQSAPAVPIAMDAFVTLAGVVALVLMLVKTANLPGDADGRELGLWLGLGASLVVSMGGAFAMRDERQPAAGRRFDLTGRPTAGRPEIETIPPPRRGQ
jgi:hypothetical protein